MDIATNTGNSQFFINDTRRIFQFRSHDTMLEQYTLQRDRMNQDPKSAAQIETLEGAHLVRPSDWIITGVKGEHYPCKPDIFDMTYEPVEQT